jgi:hypothetical protein
MFGTTLPAVYRYGIDRSPRYVFPFPLKHVRLFVTCPSGAEVVDCVYGFAENGHSWRPELRSEMKPLDGLSQFCSGII